MWAIVRVARAAGAGLVVAAPPAVAGAGELARPSDSFVDSMGVNTHAAFPFVASRADWNRAAAAVGDIGFRYVRDIPDDPVRLNALTAMTGAKVCVIVQSGWDEHFMDIDRFASSWANTKAVNNVAYLELPNEPDPFPNWAEKVRAWTLALHAAKTADPALAATPMVAPWIWAPEQIADLAPYLDYGNVHSYANGFTADSSLANTVYVARRLTGDKPILATEAGYCNAYNYTANPSVMGVHEATSAKTMPRVFLSYFNAGITKTFSYDLMDDYVDPSFAFSEAHFGLLRTDFSYKPAAVALKNLIALLKDPGEAFTPSSLGFTLSGAGADVRHTLLQKRDGTFWLALWREVQSADLVTHEDLTIAALNVALHLDTPVVRATTYMPNVGADGLSSVSATRLVDVAVDDRVTLISLRLAAPGDANADGLVDDRDLATFIANYGTGTTWEQGDFNHDGAVGFVDFQMLELHYGDGFSAAQVAALTAAGVPEPGAAMTPAIAALAAMAMRRRRRRRRD